MGIAERQKFLADILTDEPLRSKFFAAEKNEFDLDSKDFELLKGIDKTGIERKAQLLLRKSGKKKSTEGA